MEWRRENLRGQDDLEAYQEEFLKSNKRPSAQIIRLSPDSQPSKPTTVKREVVELGLDLAAAASESPSNSKRPSRFAQERNKLNETNAAKTKRNAPSSGSPENSQKFGKVDAVLFEVKERPDQTQSKIIPPSFSQPSGFPEAKHRNEQTFIQPVRQPRQVSPALDISGRPVFGSLFSVPVNPPVPLSLASDDINDDNDDEDLHDLPPLEHHAEIGSANSKFVLSEEERKTIDQQNLQTIAAMSSAEIIEAQESLRRQMNPNLFNKLQQKLHSSAPVKPTLSEHPPVEIKATKIVEAVESGEVTHPVRTSDHASSSDAMMTKTLNELVPDHQQYFKNEAIEADKLSWMMDTQTNNPSSASPESVISIFRSRHPELAQMRFDFEGTVVAENSDVPVSHGLHHHGDEPDKAGYTIGEILHLSRSALPAQRIITIKLLGVLLHKAKAGFFGPKLTEQLQNAMEDMNVLIYLRSAMDDSNQSVLIQATHAMARLVGCLPEESALRKVHFLYRGQESAYFNVALPVTPQEERELNDELFAQRDIVTTLVTRMQFLDRCSFLLDKISSTQPDIIEPILLILLRIARHNNKTATSIAKHSQLLDNILRLFIAVPWPQSNVQISLTPDEEGLIVTNGIAVDRPHPLAFQLIRTLAQSSRENAEMVIAKGIFAGSLRYILTAAESTTAQVLRTETLLLWRCLASYGLAMDAFLDMHADLFKHVSSLVSLWSLPVPETITQGTTALFLIAEAYTNIASSNSELANALRGFIEHTSDLIWRVWAQSNNNPGSKALLAALFNFIASQVAVLKMGSGANDLRSLLETRLLSLLDNTKDLLQVTQLTNKEGASSPLSFPLICLHGWPSLPGWYYLPVYHQALYQIQCAEHESVRAAVMRFIAALRHCSWSMRLAKAASMKLTRSLDISDAVDAVISQTFHDRNELSWLSAVRRIRVLHRQRHLFLRFWLNAHSTVQGDLIMSDVQLSTRYCEAVGALVASAVHGDEYTIMEQALSSQQGLFAFDSLRLGETLVDVYKGIMVPDVSFKLSRVLCIPLPVNIPALALDILAPHAVLPVGLDWMFAPISDTVGAYQQSLHLNNKEARSVQSTSGAVAKACLHLIEYFEQHAPKIMSAIDVGVKLSYLIQVFLVGDLYIRDDEFRGSVSRLFDRYVAPGNPAFANQSVPLRFKALVFHQLYLDLLKHYASEFADALFARVLLLQLQTAFPLETRMAFWSDLVDYLGSFTTTIDQVPCPGGIANYLYPLDSKPALLALYARALINKKVQRLKTPFLYFLTIHHLAMSLLDGFAEAVPVRMTPFPTREELEEHGLTTPTTSDVQLGDILSSLLLQLPNDVLMDFLGYNNQIDQLTLTSACFNARDQSKSAKKLLERAVNQPWATMWRKRCITLNFNV